MVLVDGGGCGGCGGFIIYLEKKIKNKIFQNKKSL